MAQPMISNKTKQEQRRELEQALRAYLDRGGKVREVPPGVSGREDHNRALPHIFDKKNEPQTRTPLDQLVAAIDQRRKPAAIKPPLKARSPKRPRKKIIYDDFGQPLRWEWEE